MYAPDGKLKFKMTKRDNWASYIGYINKKNSSDPSLVDFDNLPKVSCSRSILSDYIILHCKDVANRMEVCILHCLMHCTLFPHFYVGNDLIFLPAFFLPFFGGPFRVGPPYYHQNSNPNTMFPLYFLFAKLGENVLSSILEHLSLIWSVTISEYWVKNANLRRSK